MENDSSMVKPPEQPAKRLSGTFKFALVGVPLLLGGVAAKSVSESLHLPVYLFLLSGILCFFGIIAGIAEVIGRIAKRQSSVGNRFVLLGLALNVVGWLGAMGAFLASTRNAMGDG
jgi:hypothetical protein